MKALPEGFDVSSLDSSLAESWSIGAASVDYLPAGFGSYHWVVWDAEARRYFVTVDDLDQKPWLGGTRGAAFAGLTTAFDTALALRREIGLDFVLAPLPTLEGQTVLRVGDRHALSVFPFVEGRAGHFGEELTPKERSDVVHMLAQLHGAATSSTGLRVDTPMPGRGALEAALDDVASVWHGGPFSEPARAWLADHATVVRRQLQELDRLAASLVGRDLVITHGEPHPGNVLRSHDRLMLIDWDTMAIAPPERDLWLVATTDGPGLAQYAEETGQELDRDALACYRLAWDLADVAAYMAQFRSVHLGTEDAEQSWRYLTGMTWIDDTAPSAPVS